MEDDGVSNVKDSVLMSEITCSDENISNTSTEPVCTTIDGNKPKRPPRSERKRQRHEELLLRRKEERKRKKIERKQRMKEEDNDSNNERSDDRRVTQQMKEARRSRCKQALIDGQKICIDCSLEQYMSEKERGKLIMQINRLYGSNLRADNPAHIYLTGLKKDSSLYEECVKKMDGFENYLIDSKEEHHTELFPLDKIVCLSPDSPNLLTDIDSDKIYIIGGLVDENIKQHVTQTRATEHGLTTARLPIEENMIKLQQSSHSKILAVNQVFDILMKYKETKDWKQALSVGVPRRKGYVIEQEDPT
ncbi:hypothetical protein ACF0H5_021583 [Mactra antiquata]